MRIIIYILFISFCLFGCNQKDENLQHKKDAKKNAADIIPADVSIDDFIGRNDYVIQEEIDGYLNKDTLKDKIVIYRSLLKRNASRTLMVLLKKDSVYKVLAKNDTIMGPIYYPNGLKINDTESIKIKDHKLIVEIHCSGPCGYTYIEFPCIDDKLKLSYYKTFDMGAGAFLQTEYDVLTKTATITTTNTLKDEMPEETEKSKLDYKQLEFSIFNRNELSKAILKE